MQGQLRRDGQMSLYDMYDMYGKCLFVHPVTYDMYGLSIGAVHSVHRRGIGNAKFSAFTKHGLRKVVFVHLVAPIAFFIGAENVALM